MVLALAVCASIASTSTAHQREARFEKGHRRFAPLGMNLNYKPESGEHGQKM
jgi:hypothetical protein